MQNATAKTARICRSSLQAAVADMVAFGSVSLFYYFFKDNGNMIVVPVPLLLLPQEQKGGHFVRYTRVRGTYTHRAQFYGPVPGIPFLWRGERRKVDSKDRVFLLSPSFSVRVLLWTEWSSLSLSSVGRGRRRGVFSGAARRRRRFA